MPFLWIEQEGLWAGVHNAVVESVTHEAIVVETQLALIVVFGGDQKSWFW
jgi:hypothetical protein